MINSFRILQQKRQLFTYSNGKLFPHELKISNYVGLDKIQRFDWIKLIG